MSYPHRSLEEIQADLRLCEEYGQMGTLQAALRFCEDLRVNMLALCEHLERGEGQRVTEAEDTSDPSGNPPHD